MQEEMVVFIKTSYEIWVVWAGLHPLKMRHTPLIKTPPHNETPILVNIQSYQSILFVGRVQLYS